MVGGDWLLGVAFGVTATAAASLDPALRQVTPIRLPNGVGVNPPHAEAAIAALRAALISGQFSSGGQPPSGLALAYPDEWPLERIQLLLHAATAVGYSANLVRLLPFSEAAGHHREIYPEDNPASAAARGALLAATGPIYANQIPQQPVPLGSPPAVTAPPTNRVPWILAAAFALVVVIAGAATAAVILTGGDDDTTVATATRTTGFALLSPTASAPTTTSRAADPSASPLPLAAAPPPPSSTPSPEPQPTATTRLAPTTTSDAPAPAAPSSADTPPTTDIPDLHEAAIRGYCRGLLNQVGKFPGGLPAMRAQVSPPPFTSPSDWSEAFDRAASGSCQ
ncbi:hypothetical protein [Nocardia sp. NBC_00511]|uniref:hypothetical protein n=1 Tax=Nocardia sp. NBC_00511 TaxID=2903591 RepID=UPI0030E37213